MADEEQVEIPFSPRKLRVQRNGRHALSVVIDGVPVRIMADGDDVRARALLADLYSTPRGIVAFMRRKR